MEPVQYAEQPLDALLGHRPVLDEARKPRRGLAAERLIQLPVFERIYDEPDRVRAYIYNAVQV